MFSDFAVSKCVGHGRLYVWNLQSTLGERGRRLPIDLIAQLSYTKTDMDYLYLHAHNGTG